MIYYKESFSKFINIIYPMNLNNIILTTIK